MVFWCKRLREVLRAKRPRRAESEEYPRMHQIDNPAGPAVLHVISELGWVRVAIQDMRIKERVARFTGTMASKFVL